MVSVIYDLLNPFKIYCTPLQESIKKFTLGSNSLLEPNILPVIRYQKRIEILEMKASLNQCKQNEQKINKHFTSIDIVVLKGHLILSF